MRLTVLSHASDAELLSGLKSLRGDEDRIVAKIVAYLVEIDRRKLYLDVACSSLFDFCRRVLRLSEGAAQRRIIAARLAQRFPQLLDAIAAGRIHLTNVGLLERMFTADNVDDLIRAAEGRTKFEVAAIVARYAPKPDVPTAIQRVPEATMLRLGAAAPPPSPMAVPPSVQVEPLSEARFKVQFTAGTALRDKLEQARALMSHANPSGDLAAVLERAVDLLIAQLEKTKHGKTARPRVAPAPANPGYVTRGARRAVVARDGLGCSFVGAHGERCGSRTFLEFDHRNPRARGGTGDTANLRILCRAHNRHAAEKIFGRSHVESRIERRRQRRCESHRKGDLAAAEGALPTSTNDGDASDAMAPQAQVRSALVGLGFRPSEAERALAAIDPTMWGRPLADLLRDAIGILT